MMPKVDIKYGTEGDKRDLHSYEEITFQREGLKVTYHEGLTSWVEFEYADNGVRHKTTPNPDSTYAAVVFKALTGITVKRARRIYRRLNNPTRCRKCDSRKLETVDGFPGESLVRCCDCGTVVASQFAIAIF